LAVVAIDTLRNVIENVYFGLFFGSQYGLFPAAIGGTLGNPVLLIVPKLINVAAGCLVLGLLLLRWLPSAIRERGKSEQDADDLKTLAAVDGLTGLYNRRHFELLARAEWVRFQRYFRPLSVLIIDVDYFKTVNDRFGHDAGDKVLKLIAIVCGSAKRESPRGGPHRRGRVCPVVARNERGGGSHHRREIARSGARIFLPHRGREHRPYREHWTCHCDRQHVGDRNPD
jgi:hypothetical protein